MGKGAAKAKVRTGLEVLHAQSFAPLKGLSIGLVTHAAAVDSNLRNASELLAQASGGRLQVVFGPEHGLTADAQDLIGIASGTDPCSGVTAHSLYGDSFASLSPTQEQLRGLDVLVIDLQDVGSRYYTFQATMLLCMEACAKAGVRVVVLDRPNPLGGEVIEGPRLCAGFKSFVGIHPISTRHGMTIGELARLYKSERGLSTDLSVIACEGWRRQLYYEETGLPWVLPSPNMPTVDTAIVYPGQCLVEGTNLSEGRGTTRPFEICGAPGIDARKASQILTEARLPGVAFRPVWFKPTFQKHAGQTCGGVQLHVLDRNVFCPVRTGWAVVATLRQLCTQACRFDWRREPYEFVTDRLAIDLLLGSERERLALESGQQFDLVFADWQREEAEFHERRRPFLLYD